jgi:hypothetical protein
MGDAHHHDGINGHSRQLKDCLNDNPDCHLEIGYREDLAHLVYAGADLLVAPSLFEPCGLAPLIAMRYGTVPVVRATGGLIDTVFDRDHSGRPAGERNGYVFHHTDDYAIESALSRALRLWSARPREFRELAVNCMRADYSWARPGERVAGFGRLEDGLRQAGDWYRWGPYVSERQWGTVREDYSANGEAWDYLPHDHARSRAYRWGGDGLTGFCDIEQRLCLGLALWNGRDPILKERAFGLTGSQGNHGEDVKEYWWYLNAVPSHAWNRWRYHYPQARIPTRT